MLCLINRNYGVKCNVELHTLLIMFFYFFIDKRILKLYNDTIFQSLHVTRDFSMTRHCKNSPNLFCYVCGKFTPKPQRRNITPLLKDAYQEYFQRPMTNLDKGWTPDQCCSYCYVNLIGVKRGKKKMPFHVPAVWR